MYLDKYKIRDLNDEELNNLEYEIALQYLFIHH